MKTIAAEITELNQISKQSQISKLLSHKRAVIELINHGLELHCGLAGYWKIEDFW